MKRLVWATILACSLVGMAPAGMPFATSKPATILKEVSDHLKEAAHCMERGTYLLAVAHADAVLVRDDLTYFVKWGNTPTEQRPIVQKGLESGLDGWISALKQTITFAEARDEASADIVITFKTDVRMNGESVAGYANWRRSISQDSAGNASTKFTADLQIRTQNLQRQPMSEESIRHEVLHEVGHVLGLEDSDEIGYVMGPLDLTRPVAEPQPAEIAAVAGVRALARKIRIEAIAQANSGSR